MKYVLSTMTGSVAYAFYDFVDGMPQTREKITVHGGTGLPSAKSGFGEMSRDGEGNPLWTASGIVTPIQDERFARLSEHPLFKKHLAGGFVKVVNSDITENHKAVKEIVKDMTARDASAQLTPATLKSKVKTKVYELDAETELRI